MKIDEIAEIFKRQVSEVNNLVKFDDTILSFAITLLEGKQKKLEKNNFTNPAYSMNPVITHLKNIKENESLKNNYRIMYNQCLVLLVSYLTATLTDLLRDGLISGMNGEIQTRINDIELKITLSDLCDCNNEYDKIANIVLSQRKDISMQDMQSTVRTFKQILGIDIERNERMEKIIVAQSLRHCIIHDNARINERTLHQLNGLSAINNVKNITIGDDVSITDAQIEEFGTAMIEFIEQICKKLKTA